MTEESHTTIRVLVGCLAFVAFIVCITLGQLTCARIQLDCIKAGKTPAECRQIGQ